MFINGQKVVCVDDTFTELDKKLYVTFPVKDVVYIVRGMAPGISTTCKTEEVAVYLEGVHNPCSGKAPHREFGFKMERFRPLEELTEEEIKSVTLSTPATAEAMAMLYK